MESKRPSKRQKVEENDLIEVFCVQSSDLSEVAVKTPDNSSTKLVQFWNTAEKSKNINILTPKTCASSPSSPIANDFCIESSEEQEQNKAEAQPVWNNSEKAKSCFRNLNDCMAKVAKISHQSFDKQAEKNNCHKEASKAQCNISSDDIEDGDDLFDFDLYSIFKSSSSSVSVEDFQPLNSIVNAAANSAIKDSALRDFCFMGDSQFPLWMQY